MIRTSSQWLRGVFALVTLGLLAGNAYADGLVNVSLAVSSQTAAAGTAVTLTGTATTGQSNTPYPHGYVYFCDASAAYCEGSALLGSAQVGLTGTATLKIK